MSVEKWWDEICGRRKREKPRENLSRLRFIHHKTMGCSPGELREDLRAHSPIFPSLHLRQNHSPTLTSLYLRPSSFSNPSIASPTSQFILQPFFRFSYVKRSSLNSPGEPLMHKTHVETQTRGPSGGRRACNRHSLRHGAIWYLTNIYIFQSLCKQSSKWNTIKVKLTVFGNKTRLSDFDILNTIDLDTLLAG